MIPTSDARDFLCGYLVVRKPSENFDEQGRGAYSPVVPQIGDVFYGGVDRMRWFDLDEDYYTNLIPTELRDIRQAIKKECSDFSGLEICKDLNTAFRLLGYSNRIRDRNEIIIIGSQNLAEMKGALTEIPDQIEWLGYDIVSLGNWSLLANGLFVDPDFFESWKQRLTAGGLLSSPDLKTEFIRDYDAAVACEHAEELPDSVHGIDAILVGRVRPLAAA